MKSSPGQKFRHALASEKPLQIVGTVNAYTAMMAQQMGFRAIYVSGAGVSNVSYGLPDLAMTTLDNVLEDVRRISSAVTLPILVDIDTGWGNQLMIARTVREMIKAGAAAVHIEDQVFNKRCGHRPGKKIVSCEEMQERIRIAVRTKQEEDDSFMIMARSDALATEGLEGLLKRVIAYQEAGAEMIFVEAMQSLEQYSAVKRALGIPILANATEFGITPIWELKQFAEAEVDCVLYPLTVARAMNLAAFNTLKSLREQGSQKGFLDKLQSREELYRFLDYYSYEEKAGKDER
ncbi:MAG: methylisocitrate lyase [Parachlamydiaceae bacterium]|nr:methylisocitrate lyase [Parachlamydiaceae bacterium]